MIDLGPFNEVMRENYIKILVVGALVIAGNLFFKWVEKKLKKRKKQHR